MTARLRVAVAAARLELARLARSRLVVVLTVVEAATFVVLVSLFGITGSRAPAALVDEDGGPYSRVLVSTLEAAHNSFSLQPMDRDSADAAVRAGRVAATVTIPHDFDARVTAGETVPITMVVDNVNVDLTDDVQRALPSAILAFGHRLQLPQLRVSVRERDLVDHDTGYIPYLTVSALGLAALVVAATLAATAVARDWEGGTLRVWRTSPSSAAAVLAGRLGATGLVAFAAVALTAAIVVLGYGVGVRHPLELVAALALCVAAFSALGACIGAAVRRSMAVVPLIFGIAFALYMDSGALEPARFDGEVIWWLAHASPIYYAVGVLEDAFHGLQVTPEAVWVDVVALAGFMVAAMLLARRSLRWVRRGA